MKKLIDIKTLKFIIVGCINTIVGMVIMLVMYNVFSFSYWLSSGTNYFLTGLLSYVLNKKFTFKDKASASHSFFKFFITILGCYLIAYSIARPLTFKLLSGYTAHFTENISMFVGMVIFTSLNYFGQRFFVFTNHSD